VEEAGGGGGDFLKGNIIIFLYTCRSNIFFSRLMAGNIFKCNL
jgi:hypothetical protein